MPRTRIGAPFVCANRRGAVARAGSESNICRREISFIRAVPPIFGCQMLGCPVSIVKFSCKTTQEPIDQLVIRSAGNLTGKFDNAHWTSQHLTSFRGRLMRTFRSVTLLFLIIVSVSLAQRGTARVTVYEGARLITGDGAAIENSAFIVDGSQFTRVGRRGEVQVPANAQHVNLTGKTVMPAKVDLHGHFGYQHDWDGPVGKEYFTRENLID